ncbi:hypothetical protein NBRC10513v2_003939 [Rhodotorula toruloides]|uniref:Glycosyl transferase CAP10 domain-containing protein n=1 Tax=Rhodotorula toruloides TaxID=5286 RepID=A0A2T0A0K5_RHOTO|nr:hypothetical protein AAT19DRAFT_10371 [Rhodotorula toruloides]
MEPLNTGVGRRTSVLGDSATTPVSSLPGNGFNAPPSPWIDQSSRVPQTPRVGATPQLGRHHRKSSTGSAFPPSPTSRWSSWFGGGKAGDGRKDRDGHLPTFGKRASAAPARPFYSEGAGRRGTASPLILARNIALRPFYLLGRRGPLLPIIGFVTFILLYLTYSTSPSSQSVKLRVQGAVGPYIPQRAADAIRWRGAGLKQAPLGADNLLGGAGGVGQQQVAKKAAPLKPEELPPVGIDSRIKLEEGKPHPIPGLMAQAKQKWEDLKNSQSRTFAQAVKEYKRRNGRNPPKGFDRWYAFAKAHKVLLIDEFDLIDKDLLMYRAFKPSVFRKRIGVMQEVVDTTWTIRVENGKVLREGPLAHHDRARGVEFLMSRFAHFLPDMTIVYNGHDGARIAVAAEERIRLEELAKKGEYDDDEEPPFWPKERGPFPHWGYPIFCPPGSPARELGFEGYGYHASLDATGYEMPAHPEGSIGSLVGDFKGYMDVCYAPHYRHTHATTSWVFEHHPTRVMPLFTPGVQTTFGDVHALIVEQLELESQHDPAWEDRPFTSLHWRGQTSGPLWESKTPWRTSQRSRLHLLSHQEDGFRNITITDENDVMRSVEVPNYRLNPLFLDTGMVGPPVQCVKEDGTCDKMFEVFQGYDKRVSFDRASLYKFVLDVDGNSWSGRFRRLMLSNAAVVKATVFPEFWTDWAIPWLHFIPMQVDYADMWDILAFYRGGINGEGAHDDLAKEIAVAGKEWVKQCYRWADLEAYQFRLLLEYGRLFNDETEPGSNDFTGDTSVEPRWNGPVKLQ